MVAEKDGVDLEFNEEAALDASNIYYNSTMYDNVQDAIDNIGDLVAPLRVPISLVHNGTVGNNTFIGYSNLLPGDSTPIVVPITGTFTGFTWSNSNSTADFALEFRLVSTTATKFFTWTATNTQTSSVVLPTPEAVTTGQKFYVKYLDQGDNSSDAVIILQFRA